MANALIDGVEKNDVPLVKESMERGVDVNGVDGVGRTALWWAANRGFVECVKLLLEANADVDKADRNGWTPLHRASYHGHVECVKLLIDWKANVNTKTPAGDSSLHEAAEGGHLACIEMLIQAGADVDARNKDGETPLARALLCNKHDVAELLHCKGAKVVNISKGVKIPAQTLLGFTGRENAQRGLLTFMVVLRKRYTVSGAGTEHIRGKLPLDVVRLLGRWVWSTRFDERWVAAIPESTSRCHLQ